MKTPQRRFVVEFKGGRRLPKTGAGSIWGDTDLKALAREVEDQSSHLFGIGQTPDQQVTNPTPDTDPRILAGAPLDEAVAPTPSIHPLADSVDSPGSTPVIVDEVVETAPPPIEPSTESQTVETPKKARRKRVPRAVPTPVPTEKDRSQTLPASVAIASTSLEELATLEAENKRLRLLLANQLRAQNVELKRMLERF